MGQPPIKKMTTQNYNKSFIILVLSLLLFEGTVYYFGANRPCWGDEAHFVDTVKEFGNNMSIRTIRHYNEMSAPLPFILYSIWGRIFSFDIQILRIFSVIIAFAVYILFYKLILSIFHNTQIALLMTAYIAINPYMVGLSVFVFTDMLSILFIILTCISMQEEKPFLLSFSLACGLLCRQYLLFFLLSVGLYYLGRYYKNKNNNTIKMLLSCIIALMPLTFLAVLWKGLSPDNELKKIYLDERYCFHLSYFTLYVCQFFIYLIPIILVCWKIFYKNIKVLFFAFIASGFYWLFPVRACKYQIKENIYTVGLFHKFLKVIFANQLIEDIFFCIAFIFGIPIIIYIVKDAFFKWRKKHLDFSFLLDLSIICFLIVMPFSYLLWEKYFLPVLPLVVIRIFLTKYSDKMIDCGLNLY